MLGLAAARFLLGLARLLTARATLCRASATRRCVNAIEAARKANGFTGQLHTIAHNSFVQMSDIGRARVLAARLGRLERGMLADLLVLDRDPQKIPVTQVHETKVKLAIVDGAIVYRAPDQNEKGQIDDQPWVRRHISSGGTATGRPSCGTQG